jgi:hypothetical protein
MPQRPATTTHTEPLYDRHGVLRGYANDTYTRVSAPPTPRPTPPTVRPARKLLTMQDAYAKLGYCAGCGYEPAECHCAAPIQDMGALIVARQKEIGKR